MTTIQPREPALADAARAGAAGLYSLEAACNLVIGTGWLHRDEFSRFVTTGPSLTGCGTELAHIDWQSVIGSRDAGLLPRGSGENRILRLAPGIAASIPRRPCRRPLRTRPGQHHPHSSAPARHANGQRPADSCSF